MTVKMGITITVVWVMVWLAFMQASVPVLASTLPHRIERDLKVEMMIEHKGNLPGHLMPSVGNGYLAHVIDGQAIYVADVFNGEVTATSTTRRAAIPNSHTVNVLVPEVGSSLNVREAMFQRLYRPTTTCEVIQSSYAHRTRRNLLVTSITINNSLGTTPCQIDLKSVEMPSSDVQFLSVMTYEDFSVSTYSTRQGETIETPLVVVAVATSTIRPMKAPAGSIVEFPILTVITTSLETSHPILLAKQLYEDALKPFRDGSLLVEHKNAWKEIWKSGVEVVGNPKLASITSASLYYILSSIRDDVSSSISPGGLATLVENGQVGWEAEAWMYSPILNFWTRTAGNSILGYRRQNVPGAESKAQSSNQGWKGAMYPWKSAFTGFEVSNPGSINARYAQYLSGQIALATRQHFYTTDDYGYLNAMFPMIRDIADFWLSRATTSPDGRYNILSVRPIDQNARVVDNSISTNHLAQVSLEWADTAARLCKEPANPNWKMVGSKLVLPFDNSRQIHLEYEGYNGTKIQQADVVLLGFPLEMEMSPLVRESDLRYYESRTDPRSPSSTWSMHSIAWLELNGFDQGQALFDKATESAHAPYWVWTETPSSTVTNYLPSAGAFLQSIINGYGGLRTPKVGVRKLRPVLPANTGELALLGLRVAGERFDVRWNSTTITVISTTEMGDLQLIPDGGIPFYMSTGKKYYLPYGSSFTVFQKYT